MKKEVEDKQLTDYLLGNLTDLEQVRLEEEYFADPRTQDRLLMVEGELIDAYLQGLIPALERKRFESGFLASPRGRRKLELARSLMALAAESRHDESQSARAREPFRPFSSRWVVATVTLALVLVLAWSIPTKVWRHPDSKNTAPENAGGGQDERNRQGLPGSAAQADNKTVPPENPSSEHHFPTVALVTLRPTGRGVEQSQQVRIPRGALQVEIRLELEVDSHASYRVDLFDAKNNMTWSDHGLKTQATGSAKTIVLKLRAALFDNGEYTLVVSPEGNFASPISEYVFVTHKK